MCLELGVGIVLGTNEVVPIVMFAIWTSTPKECGFVTIAAGRYSAAGLREGTTSTPWKEERRKRHRETNIFLEGKDVAAGVQEP